MNENSSPTPPAYTVRYSRVIGPIWAVAIGLTITVGLGVFTLMGVFVTTSTRNIVGAFLLSAAIALDI